MYYPRIGGYCIRVVVTEINPQAYYKTLEVTDRTTAFEVIVKLIQKYAVKEEDRDPNEFYLMEVCTVTTMEIVIIVVIIIAIINYYCYY